MSGLPPRDRWVITLVVALLLAAIAGFALSAPGLSASHAASSQALAGDQRADEVTEMRPAVAGQELGTNQ